MPLENNKWRVVKGDCLWNIAASVYKNGARWTEIADANGISRSRPTIFPGQVFTLPGITPGAASNPPAAPSNPPVNKVRIDWFCLTAGSQREVECMWSWSGPQRFWVKWEEIDENEHKWTLSETTDYHTTTGETPQSRQTASERARRIRVSIRPVNEDVEHNGQFQANTDWVSKEYDFRNNPPNLSPNPEFTIDNQNKLTVTLNNIEEDINADSIEIAIYQDDIYKYNTVKAAIDTSVRMARYVETVPAGHTYKVRCRAVRGNIYGGWTNFTSNEQSCPIAPSEITTLRPQVISEQLSKQYGVFIEWPEEKTAKTYEVQWTTNVEYFDVSTNVQSQTTEEGKGPRLLITNIEVGHEYFFRVRSVNDKGPSINWTPIRSVILGIKPSAPTTWSNTSSAVIGEDLNLYWTHNSTDGSYETYARLHITVIDSANPDLEPMEYTKVIENTKPEEEKDSNSVYTINTDDDEWALVQDGFIIKWKVQTAGIIGEYSEWSIEREVSVYAKPELVLDITNKDGTTIDEINTFPFHFSVLAKPATQKPISYYIEVISNGGYDTVDEVGNIKTVNPGDKVYQRYYDPDTNAWRFLIEMTPANIDLESGINYTVNVTVSMDSGLNATATKNFDAFFGDSSYEVYGNIIIDKETLTASIHPYCTEYYEDETTGELTPKLSDNCKLSVYRREFDGTFMEIATEIENEENTYVVDPHPSLDYARYRIVARTNDTGAISYSDVSAVKVGEPSVVIQWSEKWSKFDYEENEEDNLEVPWAGSMLKIPYNIDISENKNIDVSLVEYAGRQHPVSYYGTQLGETASWSVEIPAEDKETLYGIRRLSRWTGDVYVREPSGTGYWANISVSYSKKHLGVTIPVSFEIKRVEGGM